MIIRSYHQKASERLNLNITVQTVLGGVATGWEQRPKLCSAMVENLHTTSVSERRDIGFMPIADI